MNISPRPRDCIMPNFFIVIISVIWVFNYLGFSSSKIKTKYVIMAYPLSSGTNLVSISDYNLIYENLATVFSTDEDGWGLYTYASTPVTNKNTVRVMDWVNLQRDLIKTAYFHITNTTTVLSSATSGVILPSTSSYVTADLHNQMYNTSTWVLANRYTCAEGQYAAVNTLGGVSTRTSVWGVTENYIQQRVRTRWANRLTAYYFFNTGGYLTWVPSHSNDGINDLDAEWAAFIVAIQNDQNAYPIKYDRNKFVNQTNGTTATIYLSTGSVYAGQVSPDPTYESGNLSIRVEAFKSNNEEFVDFIITFRNNNSADLVVTPAVGYWSYQV